MESLDSWNKAKENMIRILSSLFLVIFLARNPFSVAQNVRERPLCATFDGGINMCNYGDHNQMVNRLNRLAEQFPTLAQVGSIGRSVQGRPLVYIKISGNVTQR